MTYEDSLSKKLKYNNFGSLRLLFAVLVIVSHSPLLIDGNRSREPLAQLCGNMTLGDAAVSFFFIVSGYLIIKSFYRSQSISEYISKRALRIIPGFAVASVISTIIIAPIVGGNLENLSITRTIFDILLLRPPKVQGAFEGLAHPYLNGSMWTIAYEFRCYLAVIFIGIVLKYRQKTGYLMVLSGVSILYILKDSLPELTIAGSILGNLEKTVRLTAIFFFGGAFYIYREYISYTICGAIVSIAALVPALFIPSLAEPALVLFGGYIIFWYSFTCAVDPVSRYINQKDISYGMYLYAWPIQNTIVFFKRDISPWSVTIITLPIVFALAHISWNFIEKPSLRSLTRVVRQRNIIN